MTHAKQTALFLGLSLIIILLAHYLFLALQWLLTGYQDLIAYMQSVFASGKLGQILSSFVALIAVPLIISGAVALIYWCFKRKVIPNYWLYLWGFWLILTTALVYQG